MAWPSQGRTSTGPLALPIVDVSTPECRSKATVSRDCVCVDHARLSERVTAMYVHPQAIASLLPCLHLPCLPVCVTQPGILWPVRGSRPGRPSGRGGLRQPSRCWLPRRRAGHRGPSGQRLAGEYSQLQCHVTICSLFACLQYRLPVRNSHATLVFRLFCTLTLASTVLILLYACAPVLQAVLVSIPVRDFFMSKIAGLKRYALTPVIDFTNHGGSETGEVSQFGA
jgi:hypothetical protein